LLWIIPDCGSYNDPQQVEPADFELNVPTSLLVIMAAVFVYLISPSFAILVVVVAVLLYVRLCPTLCQGFLTGGIFHPPIIGAESAVAIYQVRRNNFRLHD